MRDEVAKLAQQEMALDERIRQAQLNIKRLSDDPTNQQLAFITYEDLVNLPCFQGDTLIAIKAPSGTRLEVPDPDEGMPPGQRRYQIFLKSAGEPIDVYLVHSRQQQQPQVSEEIAHAQVPLPVGVAPSVISPEPLHVAVECGDDQSQHSQSSLPRPNGDLSRPPLPTSPYRVGSLRRPDAHWAPPPDIMGGVDGYMAQPIMKLSTPVDYFLTSSAIDDSEGICDFFTEEETLATNAFLLDDTGAGDVIDKSS